MQSIWKYRNYVLMKRYRFSTIPSVQKWTIPDAPREILIISRKEKYPMIKSQEPCPIAT